MKYLSIVLIVFLGACQPKERTIEVVNTLPVNRTDEPVILQRKTLERGFHSSLKGEQILVLQGTDTVPSQCDDIDGDGIWDECVFFVNIPQSATVEYRLMPVRELPRFRQRTNVRMARIIEMFKKYEELNEAERIKGTDTKVTSTVYQLEGPGWENDRVAFRNYLDERNGMDIFGKVVDTMVLDFIGRGDDYHSMGPWGVDILKVGNSLGAGGIALLQADTLVRGGIPSRGKYRLITKGPLRSRFVLSYENWKVGNVIYDLYHTVTILGGTYGYESTIQLKGSGKDTLVAGIVKLHSDTLYVLQDNPKFVVLATYDKQAFNGEYLGLGLIVPREVYLGWDTAPEEGHDVVSTYYARLLAENSRPVSFRFYACWELSDKRFASRDTFLDYLKEEAGKMAFPLQAELK
ncbi:MAG: DUF4861 domain-containing protein [Bacteroidales bacterium]|nr:DUF4861 domain-containing protein [Bacteroidales bacterium]